mmetsp:Transcript_47115/g.150408  ORF Transcript_47115/g.150408 Transcript_47115/m.150408 type:complete len:202 (+) Transcript_47115:274-879(+)
MDDLDAGVRYVHDMPLGCVVEEPMRLEDSNVAFPRQEAAHLSHGLEVTAAHVPACAQRPPEDRVEETLAEQGEVVVVRLPALQGLQLLDDRDQWPEVREEDHVPGKKVLELVARWQRAAPDRASVLGDEDTLQDLQPSELVPGLGIDDVPREAPIAGVRPVGGEEGHLLRPQLAVQRHSKKHEGQEQGHDRRHVLRRRQVK